MSTETDPQVAARSLCAGRPVLSRLRRHNLADDVTWILPTDLLPDLDELEGVPVVHADVPGPLLVTDRVASYTSVRRSGSAAQRCGSKEPRMSVGYGASAS